jgi:hypothetical protein
LYKILYIPNRLFVPSLHATLHISSIDNYFLLIPSPFEALGDLCWREKREKTENRLATGICVPLAESKIKPL